MQVREQYDVIVVGGGHAGTEAALAAVRAGARTLLLTQNIETLGQMSCNPAIGGIGKGHLVREIDALGGVMGRAADRSGIQYRRLNASKGPAVRATRAQIDRSLYRTEIRRVLENTPGLVLFQQSVEDLIVEGDVIKGVRTQMGLEFFSPAVVLTVGTFLAGLIHIGQSRYQGGRAGDPPANALADGLRERGLAVGRLKTGTPPRLDGKTLDYSVMTVQPGDTPPPVFSFLGSVDEHPDELPCHITHTNERTHEIIAAALDRSPLYNGEIEGTGPRYCPSVEDKIVRFADKTSHQIFVEPEGLNTCEVYPNGISTSLPYDVQTELVRSIRGFENAHITRPGYAIEYDFFDPRQLRASLESRAVKGLFLAGQINGTTGYEEAAAQGLIAGLNAARQLKHLEPWTPGRDEAYIGVMIDDLITRGATEPYRMFTSRAEYRLLLREDNADLRLTAIGRDLGLVDDTRWRAFEQRRDAIERERARTKSTRIHPGTESGKRFMERTGEKLSRDASLFELLRRPGVGWDALADLGDEPVSDVAPDVAEQVEIEARYLGYVERQQTEIERQSRQEHVKIPADFDYNAVTGLSAEARQQLTEHEPDTVGRAARIPGMTPAAISLLLIHLRKRSLARSA